MTAVNDPVTTPPTTPTTPTTPAAPGGQIVLGQRITPGSARLFGRTGCVSSAFNARVRGAQVARVVFTLDCGRNVNPAAGINPAQAYSK